MWSVLDTFSKEETLSCLILCLSDWRLDNQSLETIKYYYKLFRPAFLKGNVVVLRTKLDADTYDQLSADGKLTEKKQQFMKELKDQICQHIPEYRSISYLEFINSQIPIRPQKRQKFAEWLSISNLSNNIFKEDSIYTHSICARSNIIQYICKCEPISMTGHAFPLPPMIDLRRKTELDALQRIQEKEIETTKRYNDEHAKILEDFKVASSEHQKANSAIQTLTSELLTLEAPIIVDKKTLSGSDWVVIFNKKISLESKTAEFSTPQNKWRTHNCSLSIIKNTGYEVVVEIQLPWLPILMEWKGNTSWLVDLWLELDGKKVNSEKISHINAKIAAQKKSLQKDNQRLEELRKRLESVRALLKQNSSLQEENEKKIETLSHTEFSSDTIGLLLDILRVK